MTSSHIGVWVNRGALLPLDELVEKSGLRLEDYHRVAIECSRWDGKLYSMPMEMPIDAIAYSIDRLQQCGVDRQHWPRPDRAMSWEEFKALAAKLTLRRPDGTFEQYGIAGDGLQTRSPVAHTTTMPPIPSEQKHSPARPARAGQNRIGEQGVKKDSNNQK